MIVPWVGYIKFRATSKQKLPNKYNMKQ